MLKSEELHLKSLPTLVASKNVTICQSRMSSSNYKFNMETSAHKTLCGRFTANYQESIDAIYAFDWKLTSHNIIKWRMKMPIDTALSIHDARLCTTIVKNKSKIEPTCADTHHYVVRSPDRIESLRLQGLRHSHWLERNDQNEVMSSSGDEHQSKPSDALCRFRLKSA